ncbi:uncharacterized protein LOC134261293 [Saccostrea cucullata]|uniref:uncharacterized protein LOC134261293 n=1 Tax=Saccostrea cuccullata TaxID=36930 RepID=UPI002ED4855E
MGCCSSLIDRYIDHDNNNQEQELQEFSDWNHNDRDKTREDPFKINVSQCKEQDENHKTTEIKDRNDDSGISEIHYCPEENRILEDRRKNKSPSYKYFSGDKHHVCSSERELVYGDDPLLKSVNNAKKPPNDDGAVVKVVPPAPPPPVAPCRKF